MARDTDARQIGLGARSLDVPGPENLMPIRNPPRRHADNIVGFPYLYPCEHCRADFGGSELLDRHRNQKTKHCMTDDEMMGAGYWMDRFGRWRQRHGHRHG